MFLRLYYERQILTALYCPINRITFHVARFTHKYEDFHIKITENRENGGRYSRKVSHETWFFGYR